MTSNQSNKSNFFYLQDKKYNFNLGLWIFFFHFGLNTPLYFSTILNPQNSSVTIESFKWEILLSVVFISFVILILFGCSFCDAQRRFVNCYSGKNIPKNFIAQKYSRRHTIDLCWNHKTYIKFRWRPSLALPAFNKPMSFLFIIFAKCIQIQFSTCYSKYHKILLGIQRSRQRGGRPGSEEQCVCAAPHSQQVLRVVPEPRRGQ